MRAMQQKLWRKENEVLRLKEILNSMKNRQLLDETQGKMKSMPKQYNVKFRSFNAIADESCLSDIKWRSDCFSWSVSHVETCRTPLRMLQAEGLSAC